MSAPRPSSWMSTQSPTPWTRRRSRPHHRRRPRPILPVHLYGQPADMEPLLEISRRHGIPLDRRRRPGPRRPRTAAGSAGTFGQSGCFSFYPGKNLGAYGEAGAVVTNDDSIAARAARASATTPRTKRYHHDETRLQLSHGRLSGSRTRRQAEVPGAAGRRPVGCWRSATGRCWPTCR